MLFFCLCLIFATGCCVAYHNQTRDLAARPCRWRISRDAISINSAAETAQDILDHSGLLGLLRLARNVNILGVQRLTRQEARKRRKARCDVTILTVDNSDPVKPKVVFTGIVEGYATQEAGVSVEQALGKLYGRVELNSQIKDQIRIAAASNCQWSNFVCEDNGQKTILICVAYPDKKIY